MAKKKIFDRDALLAEYKTLTMRADKRLQRLEKYMQRPGYETLAKGAYKRAMRDIGVWSGKGHKRFGTKAPEDNRELQAKINDIKSFLRADTSTMRPGIDTQGFAVSTYEKAADTFNQRYGGNLTWQELNNYYGSKKAAKIAKQIQASKTVARALGKFKELREKNPKISGAGLRRELEKNPHLKLDDDAAVNEAMKRMIQAGISPRTMFKGR